jgi:hypothetical protein
MTPLRWAAGLLYQGCLWALRPGRGLGVRVDGRLPEPCREADGNGAGQVTGRRRVARHAERGWSGR